MGRLRIMQFPILLLRLPIRIVYSPDYPQSAYYIEFVLLNIWLVKQLAIIELLVQYIS